MEARFHENSGPTTERLEAIYTFPNSIAVKDNAGGVLMTDDTENAQRMGTWCIKENRVIFDYDADYLNRHPSSLYVKVIFEFELENKDVDQKLNLNFRALAKLCRSRFEMAQSREVNRVSFHKIAVLELPR